MPSDDRSKQINDEGSQKLPKRSPIEDAIIQAHPEREFTQEELKELEDKVAEKLKEIAATTLHFKDTVLPGFNAYMQLSKAIQQLLLDSTDLNAAEKEMIRDAAKADESAGPDASLKAGQKLTRKLSKR